MRALVLALALAACSSPPTPHETPAIYPQPIAECMAHPTDLGCAETCLKHPTEMWCGPAHR